MVELARARSAGGSHWPRREPESGAPWSVRCRARGSLTQPAVRPASPCRRRYRASPVEPERRLGAGLSACSSAERLRRAVDLEEEPTSPVGPGLYAQLRAHGADQLGADREPEARAREVFAPVPVDAPDRLVQRRQTSGVESGTGVAHRELHALRANRPRRQLDVAAAGQL